MRAVLEAIKRGFSLDRRSVALFRMVLGSILIVDLSTDFIFAGDLYTRDGLLPRSTWSGYYDFTTVWSLHALFDTLLFVRCLIGVQILLAGALVLGFRSKLAAFGSWVLFVSLINRNLIATDGGDQIASYLLFCAMFLPLGDRFSLDHRRARFAPSLPTKVFNAGTIMLVSQLTILYVFAGITKLEVSDWRDGSALDLILRWNEYARPAAALLRQSATFTRLVSYLTPWCECFGVLGFFICDTRGLARLLAVMGFIGLHIGIHLSLSLSLFSFYPMAGLLALLPEPFWRFTSGNTQRLVATSRWRVHILTWQTRFMPKPAVFDAMPIGSTGLVRGGVATRVVKTLGIFLAACSAYSAFPAVISSQSYPYPPLLENLNNMTFGWQNWNLFHQPPHTSGWYRACGVKTNGTAIDLLAQGAPYSTAKPANPTAQYPGRRWFSFILRAHSLWDDAFLRQATARLLAEEWNQHAPPSDQVEKVDLIYFRERHIPFGPNEEMEPYLYAAWGREGGESIGGVCYQGQKDALSRRSLGPLKG